MGKKNNQKVLLITVLQSKNNIPKNVAFQYDGYLPTGIIPVNPRERVPLWHYSDEGLIATSHRVSISEYCKGIKEKVDIAFAEYQKPIIIAASHSVVEILRGYFKKEEFVTVSEPSIFDSELRLYIRYEFKKHWPTVVIDKLPNPLCN
jgi:hypothetical protein